MSVAFGQPVNGSAIKPIPLAADGLSVAVGGTITATVDTSGLATSAKQDTAQTSLTALVAGVKQAASTSTDAGANNSLTDTNSHQFVSKATTIGEAIFTAPIANTAPVYLGRATGVTTAIGIELLPGEKARLPCANTNEWWAITGTSTQSVRVCAL